MSSKITAFNSLVTPSPHHIPGYGGYIPQRKYKIGGSFSKTTHEILGDKNNSSGNLVLRKIKPVQQKTPDHHSNLVPGYTGYIPKGEHYFGLPYVTACSYAKGELIGALKQDAISQRMNRDNLIRQVPLSPIRSSAEPYVGATRRNPSKSSTLDYHISGYTGFLPMSRNKISMGYPSMTQEAISDYRLDYHVQLCFVNDAFNFVDTFVSQNHNFSIIIGDKLMRITIRPH